MPSTVTMLARLQSVTASLSRATSPEQVARIAVAESRAVLDAKTAAIALVSNDGQHLDVVDSEGIEREAVEPFRRVRVDANVASADAVRTAKAIFLDDRDAYRAAYPHVAERSPFGEGSKVALPLEVGGGVLGVLGLGFASWRPFDTNERTFMNALATVTAQALDRALTFAAAAHERERLRVVFDQLPAIVAIHRGPDHVLESANAAALRLPIFRAGLDRPARSVMPPGLSPDPIALLDDVFRTGEVRQRDVTRVLDWDASGKPTPRHFSSILQPLRSQDGTVEGVLVVSFDQTEVVRANERLAEALGEAEAANRLKDEFLATVSHELRTPLNAILGWASLLRSSTDDGSSKGLEVIERNARALARLVDDILDVSRIVRGQLHLELQQVDVGQITRAALETLRPAATAKKIALDIAIAPELPAVRGDPVRLQQVVWNLASNAVKFTPEEGRVSVDVGAVPSGVRVAVSDNGPGIPAEFLPHVFEPFRQYDSSSTRPHGGLGLGLAVARQLVELHGGKITAESAGEGAGATFTLELPSARSFEMSSAQATSGAPLSTS